MYCTELPQSPFAPEKLNVINVDVIYLYTLHVIKRTMTLRQQCLAMLHIQGVCVCTTIFIICASIFGMKIGTGLPE